MAAGAKQPLRGCGRAWVSAVALVRPLLVSICAFLGPTKGRRSRDWGRTGVSQGLRGQRGCKSTRGRLTSQLHAPVCCRRARRRAGRVLGAAS